MHGQDPSVPYYAGYTGFKGDSPYYDIASVST